MKLKKILKRLASVCIVGSISASLLPPNLVFANLQRHISNLTIASIPTSDTNYRISLSWNNPNNWSTTEDPQALNGADIHEPAGYLIEGLNATANETKYTEYDDIDGNNVLTAVINPQVPLTSGSIYEFRVMPHHEHTYELPNSTTVKENAPYENNDPEKVLFMTDIQVNASGSGNILTVNWDNPQYKGRNIFNGYRIYYQRGGSIVTAFNTYKDINIDDEAIRTRTDNTRNGVQILSYDIYDENLIQGEYYAVKVEPLYNSVPVRDLSLTGQSYRNISIGDDTYRMSFRYMTDKEYRTNEASIAIPLEVYEDGKEFLKLHWWGISNTIGSISRIEIYDGDSETDIGNKIGTIFSPQAIYVNTWQIDKPTIKKYYKLLIYVDGKDTPIESAVAVYDPSLVNITPNKPDVYVGVDLSNNRASLDVYWEAFVRSPYNENEEAFVREDGTYVDTNVVYDLWVADTLEAIHDVNLNIKALSRVPAADLNLTENENLDLPCYNTVLNQYATSDGQGGYTTASIEKNKTYYIKLVAIKPCEDVDKMAEPVYISVYVPTDEDISSPQSLNKPPLRIKRNENGEKVIDQSSITVEWNSKWYEVYDSQTDDWYSIVSLRDSQLIYGVDNIDEDNDTLISLYSARDEGEARELFKAAGLDEDSANNLELREIDLSAENIKYELKCLTFNSINQEGGYITYLKTLLNSEDQGWTQIEPGTNISGYLEYAVTGLEKNTAYVIILRPYRILSDGTKQAYPTYVIGTTLPDETAVEVQPTVPTLQEVEHDDVSFEVKWEKQGSSMSYELAVNEILLDDPASAALVKTSEDIAENGIEKVEEERIFLHYTVTNLFPQTGYYVWLRAISQSDDGDMIYSQWSNPIYIETDELLPPDAPDGLGPASSENLKIYNTANSTEYIATNYDYLIVEWLKVYGDKLYKEAENKSGDGYNVLDNENFDNSYMVMFSELNPNQVYYFRVKTRLTVSMDGEGGSVKEYSYILQMADNYDFENPVEVIVPEDKGNKTNTAERFYVSESEWSDTVNLYTEPSDDEYNSDKNPDFYPLPDEDFEVIYDYPTRSLTYRFRSDKEDSDGMDDNLVDQRFISRLASNNVFVFPLDLTSYLGGEIKQRIVDIPYTVMTAFKERKISLKVTANNATFTFKPGFLDTAQFDNISNYGLGADVKIIITEKPSGTPALSSNQGYLSAPQNVSVTVSTPTNITILESLGENLGISMKLDNRYSSIDSNVGLYYDTNTSDLWNRLEFSYDNATGSYNAESARLATYSVIASAAPLAAGEANSLANSNIGSVASRLNITDMTSYKPDGVVSVVQFNNIAAAIAAGRKDVALSSALSTEDYNALSKKGILLTGSVVSREQAVNALIKLYEAKTGRQITYYTPLESSSYASEIGSASDIYRISLLKAADLGFFDTSNGVRPKDVMSLNELFYMTNIVLADSNY